MYFIYQNLEDGAHLIHQTESIDEANQVTSTTPNTFVATEEQLREYTNQQQPKQRRGIIGVPRQQGGQPRRGMNPNPGMFRPHIVRQRRRY